MIHLMTFIVVIHLIVKAHIGLLLLEGLYENNPLR